MMMMIFLLLWMLFHGFFRCVSHKSLMLQIVEKGPLRDFMGRPLMTPTNESNPWWGVFKKAVEAAGGKLAKPEILASATDARFARQLGIPTLGFSPMPNTPILLHDHNEVLLQLVYVQLEVLAYLHLLLHFR